jgi:hypothetical protein
MPIRWEKTFGGADRSDPDPSRHDWDERNPIGCGFACYADHLLGKPVPNIEYPNEAMRFWNDRPRPAGTLPLPRHWKPRRNLAGTYDDAWQKTRAPLWPGDLDEHYFMAAPEDQRAIPHLKGGEEVVIDNMHPQGRLHFALPRLRLLTTVRIAGRAEELRPALDAVHILPDKRRLVMTWRAAMRCHGEREQILATDIWLKPWADKG